MRSVREADGTGDVGAPRAAIPPFPGGWPFLSITGLRPGPRREPRFDAAVVHTGPPRPHRNRADVRFAAPGTDVDLKLSGHPVIAHKHPR